MDYHRGDTSHPAWYQCFQQQSTSQSSPDSCYHCPHSMACSHGDCRFDMPSTLTICLCLMLFAALGTGWVKGYDVVKSRAPKQLAKFYLAYAVFRMITVLLVVAVYVFLISDSLQQSKAFAVMIFIMYVAMMAVTLKLKH